MKKTITLSAALLLLFAVAVSAEGNDEVAELKALVKKQQAMMEMQQNQLNSLTKRLDELEKKNIANRQPAAGNTAPEDVTVTARLDKLEKKTATLSTSQKKMAWTEKVKIKGDIRYRYENREVDDETKKNRHRFRARVGTYIDATDELSGGFRLASGSSEEAFSANQTLESYATEKQVWIDLAYIDYHPDYAEGLHFVAGKMQTQWIDEDTMFWDGDVNPEGLSLAYNHDVGPVNLSAQAGHFFMSSESSDDVRMTSAQLAGSAKLTDHIGARIGGTAYIWHDIQDHEIPMDKNGKVLSRGNNTIINDDGDIAWESDFNIMQCFGDVSVKTEPANLNFFGEYAQNIDAINDKDTAWLAGAAAKRGKFSLSYNFRDMQENSIIALFTDSDMADGVTGRGHKIKAKYEFNKHFYLVLCHI